MKQWIVFDQPDFYQTSRFPGSALRVSFSDQPKMSALGVRGQGSEQQSYSTGSMSGCGWGKSQGDKEPGPGSEKRWENCQSDSLEK